MLVKDLIKELEKLINPEQEEVFGDAEIMIDVFQLVDNHLFEYKGFSPTVKITYSADGVYPILTAFI